MQNKLRALRRPGWLCVLVLLWSHFLSGQVTNSESFDNTTFPPSGWTNHHSKGTGTTQNWARMASQGSSGGLASTVLPHSGAAMADFNAWNFYYPCASALGTYKFDLSNRAGHADTVWFWVYRHNQYTSSYHDSMEVYLNTSDTILGATKLGCIHGNINYSPTETTTGWHKYGFALDTSYHGASNYIIFNGVSTYGPDILLDDVSWNAYPPSCSGVPSAGVTFTSPNYFCGNSFITATDTGYTSASGLIYRWGYSYDNVHWIDIPADSNPNSATFLADTTTYYWLTVKCKASGDSSFSTYAYANQSQKPKWATIPYSQDFESWQTSSCVGSTFTNDQPDSSWFQHNNDASTYGGNFSWRRNDQGSTAGWNYTTLGSSPTGGNHSTGSYAARLHSYNNYSHAAGTVSYMDLYMKLGSGQKKLTFDLNDYYYGYGYTHVYLMVSSDGGATFTNAMTISDDVSGWKTYSLYTYASGKVIFRFQVQTTYTYSYNDVFLDNVNVSGPCSGPPTAGTASASPASYCGNATVTLSLTGNSSTPGIKYQWQDSSAKTGGHWVNLPGDTMATSYASGGNGTASYRCKLTCSTTGDSVFAKGASATQNSKPAYSSLPYFQDFESWQSSSCVTGTYTKDLPDSSWNQTYTSKNYSWRRDDQGTSGGWDNATYGNLTTQHTSGSHSARFHSYNYQSTTVAGGYGDMDVYLNMSGAGTKKITFDLENWYYGTSYDSLIVMISGDAGATFSRIASLGANPYPPTSTYWKSYAFTTNVNSATAVLRFRAITNYATYDYNDLFLDNLNVVAPCSGPVSAGTASTSASSFCGNLAIPLTSAGASVAPGVSLQWQDSSSLTGGGWAKLTGDTTATTNGFANTTTYFRLKATCRTTGDTSFSNSIYATQAQPVSYATLPYFQGFENWSTSSCVSGGRSKDIPDSSWGQVARTGNMSWRRDDQGSSAGWTTNYGSLSPTHTQGSHSAYINSYNSNYIFTAVNGLDLYVNMGSAGTKQLTFDYNNYYYGYGYTTMNLQVSTDGGATFTTLASYGDAVSGWQSKSVNVTSTSATTVLRWYISTLYGYAYDQIAIDNVNITLPCSGPPSAGTAAASPSSFCGNASLALTLNSGSKGPGISYQWQDSTALTGGAWANLKDTLYTGATGLMVASGKIRVKTTCRNTGDSSFSSTVSVTQSQKVPYATLPYTQGFESWSSSSCVPSGKSKDIPDSVWSQVVRSTDMSWRRNDQGSTAGWTTNYGSITPTHTEGSYSAYINSYNSNYSFSTNNGLDLYANMSGAGTKQLTFDFNNYYYGYGYSSLDVMVSKDGGATFSTLASYSDDVSGWRSAKVSINSTSATSVIRFHISTTYGYIYDQIALDNISVTKPCAGPPTAGTASTTPSSFCANATIALNLTGFSNAPGVSLQWEDSASGVWSIIKGDSAATGNTLFATSTHYLRTRVTCRSTGDSTFTKTYTASQSQSAKYATLPYFQGFEAWSTSSCVPSGKSKDIPDSSWGQVNRSGDKSWRRNDQGSTAGWSTNYGSLSPTHSQGSYSAAINSYNSNYAFDGNQGLDLYVDCGFAGTKQLSFDYYDYYYGYGYSTVDVQVSTNGGKTFSTLASYGDDVSGWVSKKVNVTSTSATTVIRFHVSPTYTAIYNSIAIDNVNMTRPCAGPPTAGSAAATPTSFCNNGQISLTLNSGSAGPGISYRWQDSTSATGGAWANLTDTVSNGGIGIMSASGKIRVKTTCRNTGDSSFSSSVSVTQLQKTKYASLPYSQDFESWISSACVPSGKSKDLPDSAWSQVQRSTDNSWRRNDQGSTAGWSGSYSTLSPTHSTGSYSAMFNAYNYNFAVSNNNGLDLYVDFSATGQKQITFDYNNYYYGYGYSQLNVMLSTDGGATFTTLNSYGDGSTGWNSYKLTTSAKSANAVLRFNISTLYGYAYDAIGLDNLAIALPCNGPSAAGTATVTPTSFCGNASLTQGLNGYYNGPGISIQWQDSTSATGGNWVNIKNDTLANGGSTFANTTMYVRARVKCRNTGDTTFSVKAMATQVSKAKYVSLPYKQSFENWTTSSCVTSTYTKDIPDTSWSQNYRSGNYSWRREDQGTTANWATDYGSISPAYTDGAHSAHWNGYNSTYTQIAGNTANLDLYVNCKGAGQKQVTFDYWNYYYGSTYAYINVLISADGGNTFTLLGSYGGASSGTWQTGNVILFNDTSSRSVLRFQAQTLYTYMYNDLALDNVVIVPACSGTPSAGTNTPSTIKLCSPLASAVLSPTGVTTGPGMVYKWQKQVGTSWVNITGATSSTYTVNGPISASTNYRLYDSCTYSAKGATSNTVTISPAATIFASLPYTQGFESWITSACATGTFTKDIPDSSWGQTASSGDESWRRYDQGSTAGWSTTYGSLSPTHTEGSYSALFNGYNSTYSINSNNSLDLYFNAHGVGNKNLTFDYANYYYGYGYSSFDVYLSKDGGATFTQIGTYGDGTTGWSSQALSLNDTSSHSVLRFKLNVTYGYMYNMAALDNVKIIPPCSSKPTAGTSSAANATICSGGTVFLSTTGDTKAPGVTYQWKKATTSGGPYTKITGATSDTFTSGTISTNTYFHMLATCANAGASDSTADVMITPAATPVVSTTKGDTICGPGVDSLFATGATSTFHWYNQATGGNVVGSGAVFTPTLNTTKSYYVANYTGKLHGSVGLKTAPSYSYYTSGYYFDHRFDALSDMVLDTVSVYTSYLGGSGSVLRCILRDNSGNGLDTFVLNNCPTYSVVTCPLGWFVPAGTDYWLDWTKSSGVSLWYNYAYGSSPYPYTLAGICNITGEWYNNTTNYSSYGYDGYDYNWKVSKFCESARTKVKATVKTPPSISLSSTKTISANTLNLCAGDSATITPSSSASPAYTYTWKDANNNTVTSTGGVVKLKPSSSLMYILTGNNGLCTGKDTVKAAVHNAPKFDTVTAAPRPTCANNPVKLNAHALPAAGNLTYCTNAAPTYGNYMYIGGVQLDAINDVYSSALTTSPYYQYYNNEYASLSKGGSYTLTLKAGPSYYTIFDAWIDYNQNGVFDAGEELGNASATAGSTTTVSITVPTTATSGTTRLRVRSNYGYYTLTDPCNANYYGETRDYNVVIGGGVSYSWSPSTGLSSSTIGKPTATVSTTTAYKVTATDGYGCSVTATDSVIIQSLKGGMAVTTPKASCGTGGKIVLSVTGNTQGGGIQWQSSSSAGGTYTNLTGTNATKPMDTVTISSKTYYRAYITCGSGNTTSVYDSAVILTPPGAPTTTADSVCGSGNDHLTASLTGATNYLWYDSATGGNLLARASSFTTPYISKTTTYYVSAYDLLGIAGSYSIGPNYAYSYYTGAWPVFNVSSPITLDTVTTYPYYYSSYPYGQGTMNISLQSASGVTIASASVAYSGLSYGQALKVPLGFFIPTGNGYMLTSSTQQGYQYYSGVSPYPITNGPVSVTGTSYPYAQYYWFGPQNWKYTGLNICAGTSRKAVQATVLGIPTVKLASNVNQVCPATTDTVNLTTKVTGTTGTLAYAYTGAGVVNTNASTTKGVVMSNDIFRVKVTAGKCSNTDFTRVFYPWIKKNNDTAVCVNANTVNLAASYFGLPGSSSCGDYIWQSVPYNHDTLTNGKVVSADSFFYYGSNNAYNGWNQANIGFNFKYFCNNYSSVQISPQGYIYLGNSYNTYTYGYPPALPNYSGQANFIALAQGDFTHVKTGANMGAGPGGTIRTQTFGASPNRKFVVEYKGMAGNYYSTDILSGQIVLYEATGAIELNIDTIGTSYYVTSGIQDSSNSIGYAVTGLNRQYNVKTGRKSYIFTPKPTVTYSWSPSTGLSTTTGTTTTATPSVSRTYVISANNGACTAKDSIRIKVNPLPTASFNSSATVVTCNSTTGLQVNFTGNGPWKFYYSDSITTYGPIRATTNPYTLNVSPSAGVRRKYTLLSISDTTGCTPGTISSPASEAVNHIIPSGGTVSPSTSTICAGGSQMFTLTGAVGTTKSWRYYYDKTANNSIWTTFGNGKDTATLSSVNASQYIRVLVQTPSCADVYSTDGILKVDSAIKLSVGTITSSTAFLSWTPQLGATSYTVHYDSAKTKVVTGTSTTLDSLHYCRTFNAYVTPNASTCGFTKSNTVSFSTPSIMLPLTITAGTGTSFKLSWSGGTGPYTVYWTYQANLPYFTTVTGIKGTSYTIPTTTNGKTLIAYVVDAGNTCSTKPISNWVYTKTNAGSCPTTAPSSLLAVPTANTIALSWSGSSSSGYYISYKKVTDISWKMYNTTSTSYTITAVNPATTYVVFVSNKCSGTTGYSTGFDTVTTQPQCNHPINLALSLAKCHGFTATWNAISGASSYGVYISYTTGGGTTVSWNYRSSSTSITFITLQKATTYTVYVKALNCTGSNGISTASNVQSISTTSIGCKDGGELAPGTTIATVAANATLNVYPNPNKGYFTVDLVTPNTVDMGYVQVYNLTGQMMYELPVANNGGNIHTDLDLTDKVASGVYFLRVKVGGSYYTARIITQK